MEDLYLYTTIAIIPLVVLTLIAGFVVQFRFAKYSKENNLSGLTGAQAARKILDEHGLFDVAIVRIEGNLTDNFNPKTNVVSLSPKVHDGNTIAAVAVAAHEVGHAIQHATNYLPVKIRTAIVPITNIGAKISIPLIILGLLLASMGDIFVIMAYVGCACFGLSTVFQLVTLPTEFNASNRALRTIEETNLLQGEELKQAKQVLSAAAMTYVAALAVSLAQLLRFLIIVGGRRRN